MRSRREQVRAYRFVTRRIVSALLGGDPETSEPPLRRAGLTMFASVMAGALVLAGFGVYGLVRPGGSASWRRGDALIVERDTGARFVYRAGRLHPVRNYASARLILGSAAPPVVTVAASSLTGARRGRPVGIPDAPDTLPPAGELTGLPWTVCAARDPEGVAHEVVVTLLIGGHHRGERMLGDHGLLVSSGDTTWLLWHGRRLRVAGGTALSSLGWANWRTAPVAPAFLDAVPAGPDLAAPAVDGAGRAGPDIGGRHATVGTVYQVPGPHGSRQYQVLLADGLAPVHEVAAELLLGRDNRRAHRLSPAAYDAAPHSHTTLEPEGMPAARPPLVSLGAPESAGDRGPAVCAAYRGGVPAVGTYRTAPATVVAREPGGPTGTDPDGTPTVTAVVVPGGHGALVRATSAPGVPVGDTYLVTDQGLRYAVPGDKALTALGYGGVTPVRVPAELLDLVPTGPVLDPSAAASFATPSSTPR